MEKSQHSSQHLLWIAVGSVFIVVLVVAAAVVVMLGTKSEPVVSTTATPQYHVATKGEVQQDLATLSATMEQANADQAAANAAISNDNSQIKVEG